MNWMKKIAEWAVIVGAINWGLYGLFKFNLVPLLFSWIPYGEMIGYILIGLAGVYAIVDMKGK